MYPVIKHGFRKTFALPRPHVPLLLLFLLAGPMVSADQGTKKVIELELGSYRFTPAQITLTVREPVVLRLINKDKIIPHNFTIEDARGELDIDVDVLAGEEVDIPLTPMTTGQYRFFCSNKMLLMKSHREKGMEGTLEVVPQSD